MLSKTGTQPREGRYFFLLVLVMKKKEGVKMTTNTEAKLEARADNLAALDREALNKTTHGIASRIDKMPIGKWQKKLMWLFGGAIFIDSLDNYVGGGILAQLISEGWSTIELNAWFTSMTMFGYSLRLLLLLWSS